MGVLGDLVKAPSRLIRSLRSDRQAEQPKSPPAGGASESLFGDAVLGRVRSTPLRIVAIAAGGLLVLGWIAWAVYVTSENGATAGLGVVIAWPALLCALALVALPFVGISLLVRRARASEADEGDSTVATVGAEQSSAKDEDTGEEPGSEASGDQGDQETETSEVESSSR